MQYLCISHVNINNFSDPPVLRLKYGHAVKARHIREGSDVYFECQVTSNPPITAAIITMDRLASTSWPAQFLYRLVGTSRLADWYQTGLACGL